ncbi:MAG: MBL fold metallo-hydrolase [bacterium]
MIISWLGFSCFRIEVQNRDSKVAVVTDPFAAEGKVKLPRSITAELVTSSHDVPRHGAVSEIEGKPFVISGPGEYEVQDVAVTGVPVYYEEKDGKRSGVNTVCYFVAEDLHLVHLGDLKHRLEESDLQDLSDIDILFVPVGGGDALDAKLAADVVSQIEPRIVIPMNYSTDKMGEGLQGVEPFLKAMGVSEPERVSKLKVTPRDLPQDETKVVVIEPQ